MPNYTNALTNNRKIWIEWAIEDDQELSKYDAPTFTLHTGEKLTFCLACFSDSDGNYFYSIQWTEKFSNRDLERWTIVDADLQCLSIKNVTEKRNKIIEMIQRSYQRINKK
ncbi:hypothetical protein [Streptococcus suis]|uniref:Uncharacterized protein n=1 Tax=Streptococcus suis TaxID=1307 RepID=A0A0Z8INW0_STRSU|nr:hypothetical protein [Streptococcus suis]NQG42599.1 hypothetical protein [Streptococcus suis]NQG72670.1 hypothetical protein [Streptococcus suis]CYV38969.1 Uncharacterised protein [Streptococcus suis]CYV79563.1 Uncharacterised protein [Streptococcus suis]